MAKAKFKLDNVYEGKNQARARAQKLRGGNNETKITKKKAESKYGGYVYRVWWR